MFGLFKVKPPLGPWEKAWTEDRMTWLADQLGISQLLETPTLVPDYEGIPNVTDLRSATAVLEFVQTWMKLDHFNARLQIYADVVTPNAIGVIDDDVVTVNINEQILEDRDVLIAMVARQLSQHMLEGRLLRQPLTSDDEWTIDLLPAFLGLGVFAANATMKDPTSANNVMYWWSARQRGHLPSRMYGYAMALRQYARGDSKNEWAMLLRQDSQVAFEDGLKYLEKTNDSVFSRDAVPQVRQRMAQAALLDELRSGTASRKISAMWELQSRANRDESESREPSERVSDLLMDCLRAREPEVKAVAATTLAAHDRSPHAAQDLADALKDSSEEVRIAAAGALAQFAGVDDESLVHDLTVALQDDVRLVVFNAARSLTFYGKAAEPAAKMLLKRLRRAMVDCRDDDAFTMMWALNAVVDDTQYAIDQYFSESDGEFREFASQLLDQLESNQPSA